VADLIRLSMDVGRISCTTDPEAARKRDEALLGGKRPDAAPFPGLADGIFMADANPVEAALVGRLGPQGRIELDRKVGRADDLLGSGWQLISRQDPHHLLSFRSREVLNRIGAKILHFDGPTAAVDVDDVYARFFEAHAVSAILVRPDFYIYCAAQTPDRLNAPVEQLERMLSPARFAAELRAARTSSAA
jgi:hypothetical protein